MKTPVQFAANSTKDPSQGDRFAIGFGAFPRMRLAITVLYLWVPIVLAHASPRALPSEAGGSQIDSERQIVALHNGSLRAVTTLVRQPRHGRLPNSDALRGGFLVNGDFSNGLTGWAWSQSGGSSAPGLVSVDSDQAVITEGDSFLVTLQQAFLIPPGAQSLSFDLVLSPGFDTSSNFIPDAFEASLLDQENVPVVPPWHPQATSFFNIQEDETVNLASAATFDGTTVRVDLSGVSAFTLVTLYFDFIGADFDTAGALRIDNVAITCGVEGCNTVPAISGWGLIVMVLTLVTVGTLALSRRQKACEERIVA